MPIQDVIAVFRGFAFRLVANAIKPGVRIGRGLRLYKKIKVRSKGKVIIGNYCRIYGIPGDRRQYATIDAFNKDSEIHIGNNVALFASKLASKYSIEVGENVIIEEASIMDTDFHSIAPGRVAPIGENKKVCGIKIGNNTIIGSKCIIGKTANIGANCSIGPCSVVKGTYPPNSFIIGNPAKVLEGKI